MEKDIEKYKSKLVVITGDFFLSDSQISKEDKNWLYPQMIQAIKKVAANSIILVFLSYNLVKSSKLWINKFKFIFCQESGIIILLSFKRKKIIIALKMQLIKE